MLVLGVGARNHVWAGLLTNLGAERVSTRLRNIDERYFTLVLDEGCTWAFADVCSSLESRTKSVEFIKHRNVPNDGLIMTIDKSYGTHPVLCQATFASDTGTRYPRDASFVCLSSSPAFRNIEGVCHVLGGSPRLPRRKPFVDRFLRSPREAKLLYRDRSPPHLLLNSHSTVQSSYSHSPCTLLLRRCTLLLCLTSSPSNPHPSRWTSSRHGRDRTSIANV